MEEGSLWEREAEEFVVVVDGVGFVGEDCVGGGEEGECEGYDCDWESHCEGWRCCCDLVDVACEADGAVWP